MYRLKQWFEEFRACDASVLSAEYQRLCDLAEPDFETAPPGPLLRLQGLLFAAYSAMTLNQRSPAEFLAYASAWKRRLQAYRALRRCRSQDRDLLPACKGEDLVGVMDRGILTFEVSTSFEAEWLEVGTAKSIDEFMGLLRRGSDYDADWRRVDELALARHRTMTEEALISTVVGRRQPSGRQMSPLEMETLAATLSLPRMRPLRETTLEILWNEDWLSSPFAIDQSVEDHALDNARIVHGLASIVGREAYRALQAQAAAALLEQGRIDSEAEFQQEVERQADTNEQLVQALAAITAIPQWQARRPTLARQLMAEGFILSPARLELAEPDWDTTQTGPEPEMDPEAKKEVEAEIRKKAKKGQILEKTLTFYGWDDSGRHVVKEKFWDEPVLQDAAVVSSSEKAGGMHKSISVKALCSRTRGVASGRSHSPCAYWIFDLVRERLDESVKAGDLDTWGPNGEEPLLKPGDSRVSPGPAGAS